ncbi:MAG: TIGR04282 family arsenosugar biosynthesis glycosyltransferase [Myxococcota bacterium]
MSLAIAIFGKVPAPGKVKTRLAPALGEEGAAALYDAMLADTVLKIRSLAAPLELWLTEESPALSERFDVQVRVQRGGDLGARMTHAFETLLAEHDAAIIVGSDIPTLPTHQIQSAMTKLASGENVLGPTRDGGYYLIGARTPPSFADVRWSTEHALADTQATFSATLLDPWFDVDIPPDLVILRAHLQLWPELAPNTAKLLARM